MSFLQPRPTYQRAGTEDSQIWAESIPLSSASSTNSKQPFLSPSTEYEPVFHVSESSPTRSARHSWRRWFTLPPGWRTGALTAAFLALVSLLLNVSALVYLLIHKGEDSTFVEVFRGDCEVASRLTTWTHLAINLLSTLLLGGSNYCMQCLCAPTRAEVDKQHNTGKYMDIGIQSLRNLKNISTMKVIFWAVLAITSIPLHLMYNSAFYTSLAVNDYVIYVVYPGFFTGGNLTDPEATYGYNEFPSITPQTMLQDSASYDRLDTKACIQAYSQVLLTERRNLILVTTNATEGNLSTVATRSEFMFQDFIYDLKGVEYQPYPWICSDPLRGSKYDVHYLPNSDRFPPCDTWVNRITAEPETWAPFGYNVDYCLSENHPSSCSFNGNIQIISVVIACNFAKAAIMLLVAYKLYGQPLITIGDAVESFLLRADPTSQGRCLISRKDFIEKTKLNEPRVAASKRLKWSKTASKTRRVITLLLLWTAILVILIFLAMAVKTIKGYGHEVKDSGFGSVHAEAVITGWGIEELQPNAQILASILIANLPQVILSFVYLNVNMLFTSMWLAQEWDGFSFSRKTLRVSNPKGEQRNTHFLQLPYKVGIPLMVLSGLLHWLVSQSIFLAVVAEYDPKGELFDSVALASCGFSPLAMIAVIVVATMIILGIWVLGRQSYMTTMPLAGSCSAVISAACHPPAWDVDAHMKPVQWGEVPWPVDAKAEDVGHCSFSSGEVGLPVNGKKYAGIKED